MKMILSSSDFSNDIPKKIILKNLPRPQKDCHVLFIPNEKATPEKIRAGKYHKRLQTYGFSPENIYVFDETRADDFMFLSLDLIYISGGNTFLTLKKLRDCHFDQILLRYIQKGVIYIGGSAGAHIVTSDLRHVALYDDAPTDMDDYCGLGLFDGILLCHYTEQRQAHLIQLQNTSAYRVFALTDTQTLIVEDTQAVYHE